MGEFGPTTSIRILGEEYQVRGAAPELVEQLAGLVDHKFRELQAARPTMDWKRLAVMVCMNIAEELYQERIRRDRLLQKAWTGAQRCRVALESALDAGSRPGATSWPGGTAGLLERDGKEPLSLG